MGSIRDIRVDWGPIRYIGTQWGIRGQFGGIRDHEICFMIASRVARPIRNIRANRGSIRGHKEYLDSLGAHMGYLGALGAIGDSWILGPIS